MSAKLPSEIPSFIRELMPAANEETLREAAENFRRYMAVIFRIHDRLKREQAVRDSLDVVFRAKIDGTDPPI